MKTIWIYANDPFAIDVVLSLSELTGGRDFKVVDAEPSMEMLSSAEGNGTLILISQRPRDSLCQRIERICSRIGIVFLPVIIDGPILYFGPACIGNASACWSCFREGRLASDALGESLITRWKAYDVELNYPPQGHLPYIVGIASSLIASCLRSHERLSGQAGRVLSVDLFNRNIEMLVVIRRHGCSNCSMVVKDRTVGGLSAFLTSAITE